MHRLLRLPVAPIVAMIAVGLSACASPDDGRQLPDDATTRSADTLRVLAWNIHHGEGNDGALDLERIATLIRDLEPDLVALQEVDRGVERTEGVDQAAWLGERTGMTSVFGDFMAYQGGEYGMAVLSAWPVVESWNHRLPDGAEPRRSTTLRVRSPDTGREIVLSDVHFYRTEEERLAQATTLDSLLRVRDPASDHPTLLVGDFNSEPGTAVIDTLAAAGWWVVPKDGTSLTFRSDDPVREIDYVMLRPRDGWSVLEHRVIDEPVASDHAPILAVLVVR